MPTALITGPTAGIGRAYATALAARGYDLVLVARDTERLEALGKELEQAHGVACEVLPADLSDLADTQRVEQRLASTDRPVDLLLNNAGFGLAKGFLRSELDDEQRLLDVLVRAVMRLSKAVLPGMVERGRGVILNVSSVAGFAPYGTYSAAKIWVTTFSEALSAELGGTGVRVIAVCPGYVHTEFHQRANVRIKGMPGFMWLNTDHVVDATLRHLENGRTSPVLIPTVRYRIVAWLARHAPRRLVVAISRGLRFRSRP